MPNTDLRLFLAVMPDAQGAHQLAELADRTAALCGGHPVPLPFMHLTLCFLGSVPAARVGLVRNIASNLASNKSCEAFFDRLALMGRNLLALESSSPPAALIQLQSTLRQQLAFAGFEQEKRPYRPHITLVRHVPRGQNFISPQKPLALLIDHVALVQSILKPQGSVYRELARWPLQE
jgi:RNA 2',3'-cyclic 3'-phosphodiesterase